MSLSFFKWSIKSWTENFQITKAIKCLWYWRCMNKTNMSLKERTCFINDLILKMNPFISLYKWGSPFSFSYTIQSVKCGSLPPTCLCDTRFPCSVSSTYNSLAGQNLLGICLCYPSPHRHAGTPPASTLWGHCLSTWSLAQLIHVKAPLPEMLFIPSPSVIFFCCFWGKVWSSPGWLPTHSLYN